MPDITPEEIQRAREWCRIYGPANCWTGTSGAVAATVVKLLAFYESATPPAIQRSFVEDAQ